MKKLIVFAIAIFGFTAVSFGQATATASSTAILLTPISILKTTDLNFGSIAASATAGTVDLDYADTRTSTTSVKLLAGTSAQKTAVFTVTGEAAQTFSITTPAVDAILAMSGGTVGVGVTGITCQEAPIGTIGGTTGTGSNTKVLHVKAQLIIPANAVAGTYSNASGLYVTVNYN
jgi:hypothetical protein